MTQALLAILGRRGRLADQMADAVTLLTRAAFDRENPRELEEVVVVGIDGAKRKAKRFPRAWARRLVRAAETGAFKRKEVKAIVETILTTEAPDAR